MELGTVQRCSGAAAGVTAKLGLGLDRSARRDITGVRIQERLQSSRPQRYNTRSAFI